MIDRASKVLLTALLTFLLVILLTQGQAIASEKVEQSTQQEPLATQDGNAFFLYQKAGRQLGQLFKDEPELKTALDHVVRKKIWNDSEIRPLLNKTSGIFQLIRQGNKLPHYHLVFNEGPQNKPRNAFNAREEYLRRVIHYYSNSSKVRDLYFVAALDALRREQVSQSLMLWQENIQFVRRVHQGPSSTMIQYLLSTSSYDSSFGLVLTS